jgi:hypothetical protein
MDAYRMMTGKPQLGRLRKRWEDNVEMDLAETGSGYRWWVEVTYDWIRWRVFGISGFQSSDYVIRILCR